MAICRNVGNISRGEFCDFENFCGENKDFWVMVAINIDDKPMSMQLQL